MCGHRLSTAKKRPVWANTAMLWPAVLTTVHPRCCSSATDPTRTRSAAMMLIALSWPSRYTRGYPQACRESPSDRSDRTASSVVLLQLDGFCRVEQTHSLHPLSRAARGRGVARDSL